MSVCMYECIFRHIHAMHAAGRTQAVFICISIQVSHQWNRSWKRPALGRSSKEKEKVIVRSGGGIGDQTLECSLLFCKAVENKETDRQLFCKWEYRYL